MTDTNIHTDIHTTFYPVTQRLYNNPITQYILYLIRTSASTLHKLLTKLYILAIQYKQISIPITLVSLYGLYRVIKAIRGITHRYTRDLHSTDISNKLYDYIVVGAGSSGAVIANRLSEDHNVSVLLIEAGGYDSELMHHIPVAAVQQQLSAHDWQYKTTPQYHAMYTCNDNVSHWPRGRVMGGCSTTNYMLYVRGNADDYDRFEKVHGCTGWSHRDMLPCFKRMETVHTGIKADKTVRGVNGPMHVQQLAESGIATHTFIKAAQEAGLPLNTDYNGFSQIGIAHAQVSHYNGRRWNTSSGYVIPVLDRPNLHVKTYTTCARVLFDSNKVTAGIAYRVGVTQADVSTAPEQYVYCRREVILSAGAVGSPQILQSSGIGDAKLLSALNIPVVVNNPAVGENLQDHMFCPLSYESTVRTISPADETIANVIRWFNGRGPFASSSIEALAFVRSKLVAENDLRPDIQLHFANVSNNSDFQAAFNTRPDVADLINTVTSGKYQLSALPTLLHPYSRGYVRIQSNECSVHPVIEPNYLVDERDVRVFVEGCRLVDTIMKQKSMRAILGVATPDSLLPDNPFIKTRHQSDDQDYKYWEFIVRHSAVTVYHPVGTCKMGRADDSTTVVTPDCRVKGVQGLRVVDASIFPELTSGNTNVPCIAAGERASEMIKAEQLQSKTNQQPINAKL